MESCHFKKLKSTSSILWKNSALLRQIELLGATAKWYSWWKSDPSSPNHLEGLLPWWCLVFIFSLSCRVICWNRSKGYKQNRCKLSKRTCIPQHGREYCEVKLCTKCIISIWCWESYGEVQLLLSGLKILSDTKYRLFTEMIYCTKITWPLPFDNKYTFNIPTMCMIKSMIPRLRSGEA